MSAIALGRHHLADFFGCRKDVINNKDFVRAQMIEAARKAKATVVADVFHQFNPHGLSGVVVIAESHLAFHSWPEYGCVAIDLFTCSDSMDAQAAIDHLARVFAAGRVTLRELDRGMPPPLALEESHERIGL